MIKGYQGDELWTAVNPATGKHEVVEPEGEFIPGETIIKLCYWKGIDGYVRIPGIRFSKSRRLHDLSANALPNKQRTLRLESTKGRCESDRGAPLFAVTDRFRKLFGIYRLMD